MPEPVVHSLMVVLYILSKSHQVSGEKPFHSVTSNRMDDKNISISKSIR